MFLLLQCETLLKEVRITFVFLFCLVTLSNETIRFINKSQSNIFHLCKSSTWLMIEYSEDTVDVDMRGRVEGVWTPSFIIDRGRHRSVFVRSTSSSNE